MRYCLDNKQTNNTNTHTKKPRKTQNTTTHKKNAMTLLALTNQNKNHQKIISQWFKRPDGKGTEGMGANGSETYTDTKYKEIESEWDGNGKEIAKALCTLKIGNIIIEITVRNTTDTQTHTGK